MHTLHSGYLSLANSCSVSQKRWKDHFLSNVALLLLSIVRRSQSVLLTQGPFLQQILRNLPNRSFLPWGQRLDYIIVYR